MSNILLTGGAGFIGSHLAEQLLLRGHQVTIIDDLNDFYSPAIKHHNLKEVAARGRFEFVEADICDREKLTGTFEQQRPQVIIHLAARAGVRPSLEQPLLYERTNVNGTLLLLQLARDFEVSKFVFASSSSVYGNTSVAPFSEDEVNPYPISPYGVTKLAGEKLCYCYAHLYRLPVVCLRFFTVYGPRQRPDLAIHKFARLISQGKPLPVFGDGSSLRDYTYIEDTVAGVLAAMDLDGSFQVINLGNSRPVSLAEMIQLLEKMMGQRARREIQEGQPGDMAFTHADLSKARNLLGYEPKVPFEEGLGRFVEWFQQNRHLG